MNDIGTNIIDAISILVEERLKKIKYDRTFQSTILKDISDNVYEIRYLGKTYHVSNALGSGVHFNAGQPVWVKIPSGNINKMHICGIAQKK